MDWLAHVIDHVDKLQSTLQLPVNLDLLVPKPVDAQLTCRCLLQIQSKK